jgi:ATP-dependent DNA helicase RecG
MGTGTGDMISRCHAVGLTAPLFSLTDGFVVTIGRRPGAALAAITSSPNPAPSTKSAPSRHQVEILRKCQQEQALTTLMALAGRSDRTKFRHQVLAPLLGEGLLQLTIPDKPRSSKQRYHLTAKGRSLLAQIDGANRA